MTSIFVLDSNLKSKSNGIKSFIYGNHRVFNTYTRVK